MTACSLRLPRPGRAAGHPSGPAAFRRRPIRRLDPADPTALHEQAAAQLRRATAEGQAAPGERLPPARDLAAVLGVSRTTVLRALRMLRQEGVLEFRRGRGITVAAAPQATTGQAVIAWDW